MSLKKMIKENRSYVLVDLRSKKDSSKGHILGAVSIPMSELAKAKHKFPQQKSAPIILYDNEQASANAFNSVRNWGYKNTTLLKGGAKAWTGRFFPGDPGSKIVYVKKMKLGQISIAEFKKIAKKMPKNMVILDVRDTNTEGKISGAINIPQAQLASRLGEVPKGKEIIVHCNTGILAGMSNKLLKRKGYKTRYLNAVVRVSSNGSFEVSEK